MQIHPNLEFGQIVLSRRFFGQLASCWLRNSTRKGIATCEAAGDRGSSGGLSFSKNWPGGTKLTMPEIVLASRNRKKLLELVEFLGPLGVTLKTVADYPEASEVDETGTTFGDNAALKATQIAKQLGKWTIGEDSGLGVDFLGGKPGIHSARYSDPGATDERNIDKLLSELADVPIEKRTSYFVSHLCLADPNGEVRARAEGKCHGRILEARHGSGGFGYDPVFEVIELHKTFGELNPVVKSVLSHRSRSISAFVPQVRRLIESGELT